MRCDGQLEEIKDPQTYFSGNHYMKLYSSDKMQPLQVKEHTAQLSRNRQMQYQQAFVDGKMIADAYLYGFYARGDFHDDSDINIPL